MGPVETKLAVPGGEVTLIAEGEGATWVVFAHGAGGSVTAKQTLRLTKLLRELGVSVARFNFLYRELSKGIPDKMPILMETYAAVVAHLRDAKRPTRLICAGHSMGGRTASMLAAEGFTMDGLMLFSYPLHPVGKPDKLRDEHLPRISVPSLCINGTQDEFCTKDLMEAVLPRLQPTWQMHWVEGADHSLEVRKSSGRTNAMVNEELTTALRQFLVR